MKRISSRHTTLIKRVLPLLGLGLLAGAMAVFAAQGRAGSALFVAGPLVLGAMLGAMYLQVLWPLADTVDDAGDALLVRRGGVEQRVALDDVLDVAMAHGNPPRIVLRLRTPGRFGDEIVFLPPPGVRAGVAARPPLADELIARIDRARRDPVEAEAA
jgi:hypothetical protein